MGTTGDELEEVITTQSTHAELLLLVVVFDVGATGEGLGLDEVVDCQIDHAAEDEDVGATGEGLEEEVVLDHTSQIGVLLLVVVWTAGVEDVALLQSSQ